MDSSIRIEKVNSRRDLRAFVKFPWQVYKGDPNWVPPLISERLDYLNPDKNPFYQHAEAALFLARRGHRVVGTIAAFVNYRDPEYASKSVGGFGFFEVLEDYAVAVRMVDVMLRLEERGIRIPWEAGSQIETVGDAYRFYLEGMPAAPQRPSPVRRAAEG